MKTRRILAQAAAATALVVGFTATVLPVSAANAAGCHGGSCDGRDAMQEGCSSDAYTAYNTVNGTKKYVAFTSGSFKFELRYSPACYAFWTRVTNIGSSPGGGEVWAMTLGYSNRTLVPTSWDNATTLPGPGNNRRTLMWGRRSGSQYGYSTAFVSSWETIAQRTWPVDYWG